MRWKTKRLGNNPAIEVQICDMRGRVAPHALASVKAAVSAKYGLWTTVMGTLDKVKTLFGRGTDEIAIRLHLDSAAVG